MPLEYRAIVARLYEQVSCQLKMDNGFLKYLFEQRGGQARVPTLIEFLVYALKNLKNLLCCGKILIHET